jgi:hypothetical protein
VARVSSIPGESEVLTLGGYDHHGLALELSKDSSDNRIPLIFEIPNDILEVPPVVLEMGQQNCGAVAKLRTEGFL